MHLSPVTQNNTLYHQLRSCTSRTPPLQIRDRACHSRLNIDMEIRPIHAIQRHQPRPTRRRNRRDLPTSLNIHLLRLGPHTSRLALNRAPVRFSNSNQRPVGALFIRRVAAPVGAKPRRYQCSLGPAVRDAREMPLDPVRVGVAVKLVAQVDKRLCGRDVEIVDRGEVEDDGAEGGARGNLFGVGELAAARARVVPGAVL